MGHGPLMACSLSNQLEVNMGEVIRFAPKSERERARLIREARAIYESIFAPAEPLNEQDRAPAPHASSGADLHCSDGGCRS